MKDIDSSSNANIHYPSVSSDSSIMHPEAAAAEEVEESINNSSSTSSSHTSSEDPHENIFLNQFELYKVPTKNSFLQSMVHDQFATLLHILERYMVIPLPTTVPSSSSSSSSFLHPSSTDTTHFYHLLTKLDTPNQDLLTFLHRLIEEIQMTDKHNHYVHPDIHYFTKTLEYPLTRFIHILRDYCLHLLSSSSSSSATTSVSSSSSSTTTSITSFYSSTGTDDEFTLRIALVNGFNTLLYNEGYVIVHAKSIMDSPLYAVQQLYSCCTVRDTATLQTLLGSSTTVPFTHEHYATALQICSETGLHHCLAINQYITDTDTTMGHRTLSSGGNNNTTTNGTNANHYQLPYPVKFVGKSPLRIDNVSYPILSPSSAMESIQNSVNTIGSLLASKIDPATVRIPNNNYPAFLWATQAGCLGAVQTWLKSSSFTTALLTTPFLSSSAASSDNTLHESTPYDLACSKIRYLPSASYPLRNNYQDILLLYSKLGIPAETSLRANGSLLHWTIVSGIPTAVETVLNTVPEPLTRQVMIISAATQDNVHAFESICTATHENVDTIQATNALQIINLLANYLQPDSIIGSGNGAPVFLHAVRAGAVDIVKKWLIHPSMNQSIINQCEVSGDLAVTLWDLVCANINDPAYTTEEQQRFLSIAKALVHAGYVEPGTLCANLKPTLAVTLSAGLYDIALQWLRNPLYHDHTFHDICTSTWSVGPTLRVARTATATSSVGFGIQRNNSVVQNITSKNPATEGLKGFRMDSSAGIVSSSFSANGRTLSSFPSRTNTTSSRPLRSFSSIPSLSSSSSTSMSRQLSSRIMSSSGIDTSTGGGGMNENESIFDVVALQYRSLTLYNLTHTRTTSNTSGGSDTGSSTSKKTQLFDVINEIVKYTSPSMIGRNGLTALSRALTEGLYDTVLYWLRNTSSSSSTITTRNHSITGSSNSSSINLAFHDNAVPLTGSVLLSMGLHVNAKSALMIACERVEPVVSTSSSSSSSPSTNDNMVMDTTMNNQENRQRTVPNEGGTIKMNSFSSLKSTQTIIVGPNRTSTSLTGNTSETPNSIVQQQKGKEILSLMIDLLHPTDSDTYGNTALHTIALTGHYELLQLWFQRYPLTDPVWTKLSHQTNTIGDTPFDCACICAAGGSLSSSNRNHLSPSASFASHRRQSSSNGHRHHQYMDGAHEIATTLAPLLPLGPATVCRDRVSALYYAILGGLQPIIHAWLDDPRCTSTVVQLRNMTMNGRTLFDICCEGARFNPLAHSTSDNIPSSSKYALSVYASRGIARRVATFLHPSSLCQNDIPAFYLAVGSSLDDIVERWLGNNYKNKDDDLVVPSSTVSTENTFVDKTTFLYRDNHGHTAFQNLCIHTVSNEVTSDDEYRQGLRTAELVGNRITTYLSMDKGIENYGTDNYNNGWNNFISDFYHACKLGSVTLVQEWLSLPLWNGNNENNSPPKPQRNIFLTDTQTIPDHSTFVDIVCDQWIMSRSTALSTRTDNYTAILFLLAKYLGPFGRNKQNQYLFTIVSTHGLTDILQYFLDDPVYSQQLRTNSSIVQRTLTTTHRTASSIPLMQRTLSSVSSSSSSSSTSSSVHPHTITDGLSSSTENITGGDNTLNHEATALANVNTLLTDYMKKEQPLLFRMPSNTVPFSLGGGNTASFMSTTTTSTTLPTELQPPVARNKAMVGFGRSLSSMH